MKQVIEYGHIEFFKQNGYLELEDFLSEDKLYLLNQEIESTQKQKKLHHKSPEDLFLESHDLFRSLPDLKMLLLSPQVAMVISQLTHQNAFRLLFDQLLVFPASLHYPNPLNISDLSFQGVLLGGLLKLSGAESEQSVLPRKPGFVSFFNPTKEIPMDLFQERSSTEYLLFAFGKKEALYKLSPKDPHTHSLKNFGYGYGDHLNNEFHPLIFKKS
jgi:hypothetical protein